MQETVTQHKIRLILFMFAERMRSCLSSAGKKCQTNLLPYTIVRKYSEKKSIYTKKAPQQNARKVLSHKRIQAITLYRMVYIVKNNLSKYDIQAQTKHKPHKRREIRLPEKAKPTAIIIYLVSFG